ncbi:hypothetical protein EW146_g5037 [Bondarzewia mesenterica]|uniref:Tetratricopeptide repeat protein 39B n=1 Tax=Bondarzewia mesenterica TaxID=1095465 RepID=A0A4S4LT96_9AGAM|nr:hypothetical protein EW146_g5037 [Bondarzewia mesenterica]
MPIMTGSAIDSIASQRSDEVQQLRTPSPMLTDSSSAPAVSTDAGTPTTQPSSLGSDISNQSLSTVKDEAKLPPATRWPYTHTKALDDIPGVAYALDLFLKSKMVESEDFCHANDPKKERLYFATGYGLIQCVKALMSYEDEDLLAAIGHTKNGNSIAIQHRKRAASLPWRLAGYVTGSSGINWIKSMSPVELHAELVYAESLFEKALLGIVYSGDWLAFIKETMQVYRQLGKYIDAMDAEAQARGEGPENKSIDAHFRSGVYLGVGLSNIILSLMPAKLLTIVELFGYKGDRHAGLALLEKAGGWTTASSEPGISQGWSGIRVFVSKSDELIIRHDFCYASAAQKRKAYEGVFATWLSSSSIWFSRASRMMASTFSWLRRFLIGTSRDIQMKPLTNFHVPSSPVLVLSGVFFLFGQGRLSLCRCQPRRAIDCYEKAMRAQNQYRNLHHISYWEMALAYLALWEISESLKCWRNLQKESTWSKAAYTYAVAALLIQLGGEDNRKEALKLLDQVPHLRQRIAGKSIPLEKFVARKARKCKDQGGRLALPALELAYILLGIARVPREVITSRMLPLIDAQLAELNAHKMDTNKYGGGRGYWDDWCLTKFLQGVCMRYVAYPDPDALLDPNEKVSIAQEDAASQAMAALESVFASGPKIELDHHLVYHAHFEYGRLLACKGDREGARKQLDLVFSGKPLEVNWASRKGKYSLESALHMRTHAALEALERGRRL